MKIRSTVGILVLLLLLPAGANAADTKPKYGPKGHPKAVPLSLSHEYFRKHAAPDFWALMPYYLDQHNEASCSVASVAMLVNGARAGKPLTADDKLATQEDLLKKVKTDDWAKRVSPKTATGVDLDQLGEIVKASLEAYGVEPASIEVEHADETPAFKAKLHHALVANEKSSKDFIVANFIQGAFTDDAQVGHIAPVGAYDAATKRVLILDPDREWYEPYWISEATFLAGMATADKASGKSRGFVWVRLRER